jgi:MYXO-CTERM domain-containing protein
VLDTNYDYTPTLTYDGKDYVLAWFQVAGTGNGPTNFLTRRISTSGALVGAQTTAYSVTGYSYNYIAVGGSASGSLLAWTKGDEILYGNRVDQGGNLLDGASPTGGFPVSEEPSTKTNLAVANNGRNYLAVWSDNRGGTGVGSIYATRVDAGGTVLDSPAFSIATGRASLYGNIVAASNGSGWVVGWSEFRSPSSTNTTVYARLVAADGSLVNGPASADGTMLTSTGYYGGVAIGSDGTDYLSVWDDQRGTPSGASAHVNLYGMRFSATGQVYPATGSTDGSFAVATGNSEWDPSVAFDGTDYLVAFYDGATLRSGAGSRLTTTGQRIDGTVSGGAFSIPAATSYGALLAFNGTEYMAASRADVDIVQPPHGAAAQSQPSLSAPSSAVYSGSSFWLFDSGNGIRIRDDASVVDTTPVGGYQIASASDGHGVIMALYLVGNDARGRIILDDAPNGYGGCVVGDYCASGICEDGVCCDHACGGSTTDCQACSVAAGGSKDGSCSVSVGGHVCRPGDACELAGTCDGTTNACPPAYYLPPNTICGAADACKQAPLCAGTSNTCEPGAPLQDGTACGDGGLCSAGTCATPVVDAGTDLDAGTDADGGAGEAGATDGGHSLDAAADADDGYDAEAGEPDSGVHDASTRDAQSEAGPAASDSGTGTDAGSDAEPVAQDSGSDASGSQVDGGTPDDGGEGAVSSDAGAGPTGQSAGCGCHTAPREPGQGWLAAVAGIGLLVGRRRRLPRTRTRSTAPGNFE